MYTLSLSLSLFYKLNLIGNILEIFVVTDTPVFLIFSFQVSFPNLEEFTLEGYDGLVDEILHARLEQLKELNLVDIPLLIALPLWEDKYQNLEALRVWGMCEFKEPSHVIVQGVSPKFDKSSSVKMLWNGEFVN